MALERLIADSESLAAQAEALAQRLRFIRGGEFDLFDLVGAAGDLGRRDQDILDVALGLPQIAFSLTLVALAVVWGADMISVYVRQTLVQIETPDAMRGRVSAVNSVFIGASNQLGEFESGVTAEWFGPVGSVVLGGIGTLIVAAMWTRLFPTLAGRDRLDVLAMQTRPAAASGPSSPG